MTVMEQRIFQRNTLVAAKSETKFALLFHTICNPLAQHSGDTSLITKHPVVQDDNGRLHIGAGNTLATPDRRAILKEIRKTQKQPASNFLEPHILSLSDKGMAWFVPGELAPMLFMFDSEGLRLHSVPWPSLIYKTVGRQLYIAAVKRSSRPCRDTLIYHAPLMNVDEHGKVCTGGVKLPAHGKQGTEYDWQKVIQETCFTHVNHKGTLYRRKETETEDLYHFWRELDTGIPKFPNKHLKRFPNNLTVETWVNKHA